MTILKNKWRDRSLILYHLSAILSLEECSSFSLSILTQNTMRTPSQQQPIRRRSTTGTHHHPSFSTSSSTRSNKCKSKSKSMMTVHTSTSTLHSFYPSESFSDLPFINNNHKDMKNNINKQSPFPTRPSQTFLNLVNSQFQLLANSINHDYSLDNNILSIHETISSPFTTTFPHRNTKISKIKSMALYLPQENVKTGQLEFTPFVTYPCPTTERVFIASDADSKVPPTIPPTLTKLPGFSHAKLLIPNYPFSSSSSASSTTSSSSSSAGVGILEEVMCENDNLIHDEKFYYPPLSLPLTSSSQTIGILIVWPSYFHSPTTTNLQKSTTGSTTTTTTTTHTNTISTTTSKPYHHHQQQQHHHPYTSIWTNDDKQQIRYAGETLSLALNLDLNHIQSKIQTNKYKVALANSLHQVKNPLQAMRTFGKLLQQNLASSTISSSLLEDVVLEDDLSETTISSSSSSSSRNNTVSGALAKTTNKMGVDIKQLVFFAENMVFQSDRLVDLLGPMDYIIDAMENNLYDNNYVDYDLDNYDDDDDDDDDDLDHENIIIFENSTFVNLVHNDGNVRNNEDHGLNQKLQQSSYNYSHEKQGSNLIVHSPRNTFSNTVTNHQQVHGVQHYFNDTIPSIESSISSEAASQRYKSSTYSRKTSTQSSDYILSDIFPSQDSKLEISFIPDVLGPIFSAYEAIASERGIQFDVYGINDDEDGLVDLPGVAVYPKLLQEAIGNVLENAIKYVVRDKHILNSNNENVAQNLNPQIRVSVYPNDEGYEPGVTILVEDNGPGIPKEERDNIFRRGHRGLASKFVPGSGIGLNISRNMIEKMGGTLDVVDNERGRLDGAILKFVLFRKPMY